VDLSDEELLESNDTLRIAVFGRQVEQFLKSDIGQYIIQSADADIGEALDKLKNADPFKPELIISIQMKIGIAESVKGWLADAIASGRMATKTLEEATRE
jgi:hypothetical protein